MTPARGDITGTQDVQRLVNAFCGAVGLLDQSCPGPTPLRCWRVNRRPTLTSVTLAILKNADSEATTVLDGPGYEASVKELEKRQSNASASAGAQAAIDGLRRHLIDDALRDSLNDLGATTISPDERLRAAYIVAHALHASLATPIETPSKADNGQDDTRCNYLQLQRRAGADRAILLRRLARIIPAWTQSHLETVGRITGSPSVSSVSTATVPTAPP